MAFCKPAQSYPEGWTATSWQGLACETCTCHGDVTVCLSPRCPNPHCDYQKGAEEEEEEEGPLINGAEEEEEEEGPLINPPALCRVSSTVMGMCVCQDGDITCSAAECQPITCQPGESKVLKVLVVVVFQGESKVLKVLAVVVLVVFQGESKVLKVLVLVVLVVFQGESKVLKVLVVVVFQGESKLLKFLVVLVFQGESKVLKVLIVVVLAVFQGPRHVGPASAVKEVRGNQGLLSSTTGRCVTMETCGTGTGCEFCSCERGQVVCRNAECGRLSCQQNKARWTDGACRECECEDGQVRCYLRTCPTCRPGTLALSKDGHCCPQCTKVCHSSCASCWGPSASQCSECQGPLLLNQGPCVDSCGEGLYPQDNTCHNCHPSCRSCQGLGGSDCLRCLRPEDVLLPVDPHLPHGTCSPSCPAHFYLDTLHTCRACHATCEACSGESAAHCLSCPPLASLQHGLLQDQLPRLHLPAPLRGLSHGLIVDSGLCVPACPLRYYDGGHMVCHVCDEQCGSCSGPGVCTSCRDPAKVLLFGECQYDRCAHQYYLNTTTRTCTEGSLPLVQHLWSSHLWHYCSLYDPGEHVGVQALSCSTKPSMHWRQSSGRGPRHTLPPKHRMRKHMDS
ncbi:hypothetical protein CRUP_020322 [Coryphaenoides rupestris]|nr:hypothetical protein CRUP_020322 [Coryphaenoides rupestris]